METIGAGQVIFCALVVIAAFAVRGVAGFGGAVVAVPLTALVLPVQIVIPVVAVLQLLASMDHVWRNWRVIVWPELLRIAPFMGLGVLIGLYLFSQLDARTIGKGLGIFVIAYALFALVTAGRPLGSARQMPWPLAATVSTGAAVIGALFGGASGPFYAMYLKALRLPRDAFRATVTMIVLMQVVLRIAGYAGLGLVDGYALLITVAALPFMLLGAKLGDGIASRVDQRTFTRIVGAVLLISGTALMLK